MKDFQNKLLQFLSESDSQFTLPDTPLYPLAFHVPMPEEIEYDNGQVSFGFSNFSLTGLEDVNVTQEKEKEIKLSFPTLSLVGEYALQSKRMHKAEFDFGGNMMPLDESNAQAAGADANDPTYPQPDQAEVDTWTDSARGQKPKVQTTAHGPTLLTSYYEHNDSFNDVFILNSSLQSTWSKDGVTAQMSRDTHGAILNDSEINSNQYTYKGFQQPYNKLAFIQSVTVAAGCAWVADNKLPAGPRRDAMNAAGAASIHFKCTLESNLGGDDIEIMKPKAVYDALDDPSHVQPPKVTIAQFRNFIEQGNSQDGGKAATQLARDKGWPILNEEERTQIREHMYNFYIADAQAREEVPQNLWSGRCGADLNQTEATISLDFDSEANSWNICDVNVVLPAFAFDLDDSKWTGETAKVVREGLTSIHFVKSLLQKKLEAGISEILRNAAVKTFA